MESILTSTKKLLGITEEYEHFDSDIIIHINTVLMALSQMGVGSSGFFIKSKDETWSEFLDDRIDLEPVKTYVYLKVKLLFDPPTSSSHQDSINRSITEIEWRLNFQVEAIDQRPVIGTKSQVSLEDHATGDEYHLYVSNGDLRLKEGEG